MRNHLTAIAGAAVGADIVPAPPADGAVAIAVIKAAAVATVGILDRLPIAAATALAVNRRTPG